MKADAFKKLIKEAVREVLREELISILSENVKTKSVPVGTRNVNTVTKFEPYKPPVSKPRISTGDPIMDLLEETKASMMDSPGAGYYPDMSQHVSAPGLGQDTFSPVLVEESFSRPEPGLDISQFDFVKNAAAVFKASQEKDKQRLGG